MYQFNRDEYEKRMEWYRDARFGMFIHWGLYSIPARGEWIRSTEEMTIEEYQKYFEEFDARDFKPREWARMAKQAGMKYAYRKGYRYAIQFDGDGQHRPEYIEAMRQKMEEGYDIVIGSRFVTEKKGWSARMIGSRVIGSAIRLTTGTRVTDPTSGMRMFNRKMIGEFALNLNYGPEPDTVSFLIKQGARVAELQVTIDERLEGESYLKPLTAIHYMARMLISILMIQNFRKR